MFDPNATYLIAGGLGGLGRSISRWMVDRGARYLVLLSCTGLRNESAVAFQAELEHKSVCVKTPVCDVSDETALKRALEQCTEVMPPIKGCVQATAIIRVSQIPKNPCFNGTVTDS